MGVEEKEENLSHLALALARFSQVGYQKRVHAYTFSLQILLEEPAIGGQVPVPTPLWDRYGLYLFPLYAALPNSKARALGCEYPLPIPILESVWAMVTSLCEG